MSFAHRILAYKPYVPRDPTWIKKMGDQKTYKYGGGSDLPEGTYTKSAPLIVNTLKTHSKDFQQAMSRLTSYINMNGDNLDPGEVRKLEQAKSGLYRAYGREEPKK